MRVWDLGLGFLLLGGDDGRFNWMAGVNPRWEKNHKAGLMGTAIRRNRFSDITNTVSSGRPGGPSMEGDRENSNAMPCPSTKDYVAQLMKVLRLSISKFHLLIFPSFFLNFCCSEKQKRF